jgi:ABC-type antimicrobial peptide transport system permease subunit
MDLGARCGDVLRLVAGQGSRLVGCGLVIGLAAAFAVTRLLASLFYGVSASDPATFILVGLSLCAVAITACYAPASGAARVDPRIVPRGE